MTWKEETREKAQQLLEKRVEQGIEIAYMFESELLQNELALLGGIDSQSTLYIMTINEAITQNNPSLDDFENAYENRVNFHNEVWTYDMYFPLYLNFPKRIIKIHDTVITKIPFKNVYDFFSRENLMNAVRQGGINNFDLVNIPQYALHFSTTGNNKLEAWNKISAQFNLLRGIIDFATLFGQVTYTFGTASRTKNEHPQWGLLRNIQRNTFEFITFRVGKEPRTKTFTWNKRQLQRFETLLSKSIAKPPKDNSLNVLADCLRLYAQAMESVHTHNCFLSLWQAGESLTRSEASGGQTKNVLNRLGWHSNAYTSIRGIDISKSMNDLATKRNEIVHRGVDRIQNSDINLLKALCDIGIKWLSEKHKTLKTTNHLDEFYRLRTSNDKMRKAIIETVKSL